MATENSYLNNALRGAGSRIISRQVVTFAVAANATLSATMAVPDGSWLDSVAIETPAAVAGTPTSCLVSVGTAAAGAQIMAATDGKAQGHIAGTIVAGFDKILGLVGNPTVFLQCVTSGGTSPTGTVNVALSYAAPV